MADNNQVYIGDNKTAQIILSNTRTQIQIRNKDETLLESFDLEGKDARDVRFYVESRSPWAKADQLRFSVIEALANVKAKHLHPDMVFMLKLVKDKDLSFNNAITGLATVKVEAKTALRYAIINAQDFDPAIHQLIKEN